MSKSKASKEMSKSSKRNKYETVDKMYDKIQETGLNRFAEEYPKNANNSLDKKQFLCYTSILVSNSTDYITVSLQDCNESDK